MPSATRPNRPAPLPRIERNTALARTAVISLILFAFIFSGLTWQMISGGDPALGSSGSSSKTTTTAAASSPPTPDVQSPAPAVVQDDGVVVAVPQTQAVQPAPSVPAPTPVQSTPS